jgi:hypothetical protein
MTEHESGVISRSDSLALGARRKLFKISREYPASEVEIERSAGLFLRASLLARFLAVYEIYKEIVHLPGALFDIGTWRGQTAVLLENFRAILEPLNLDRRVFAFDTFTGYVGFSDRDRTTNTHRNGTYVVESNYAEFLRDLLLTHEQSNAMGHFSGKHEVVEGDVVVTIPKTFAERPELFLAGAFIDLNSVQPSEATITSVWERLVPRGLLVFWQLTQRAIPGDAMAYVSKILLSRPHEISRSQIYPGLCVVRKHDFVKVAGSRLQ